MAIGDGEGWTQRGAPLKTRQRGVGEVSRWTRQPARRDGCELSVKYQCSLGEEQPYRAVSRAIGRKEREVMMCGPYM
jgi:hypothetical protein